MMALAPTCRRNAVAWETSLRLLRCLLLHCRKVMELRKVSL